MNKEVEVLVSKIFPNVYRPKHNILLPFYHNVNDENPVHTSYLFEIPTVQKFIKDLDYLCRRYEPVDLATVIDCVENNRTLPKLSFHLTFDDGFRELYDPIAPILLQKGIPATFFVCSSAVNNKALLTTNLSALILQAAEQTGEVPPEYRDKKFAKFHTDIRKLPWHEPEQAEYFRDYYDIDVDCYLQSAQPYLTSVQIRELAGKGFTFGSHSDEHLPFKAFGIKWARQDIATSVAFIRDELGLPCESFAFPFNDGGVSRDRYEALRENGVKVSFGTAGPKLDSVPFSLQRYPLSARFATWDMCDVLSFLAAKDAVNRLVGNSKITRAAKSN
jgi:peptidoglycan/xylan/chitin deacetylase (PgdA/CDA1 family)